MVDELKGPLSHPVLNLRARAHQGKCQNQEYDLPHECFPSNMDSYDKERSYTRNYHSPAARASAASCRIRPLPGRLPEAFAENTTVLQLTFLPVCRKRWINEVYRSLCMSVSDPRAAPRQYVIANDERFPDCNSHCGSTHRALLHFRSSSQNASPLG